MTKSKLRLLAGAGLALFAGVSGSLAEEAATATQTAPLPAAADSAAPPEAIAMNPDEMADYLNSQQQIQQSFTFTRTIDGEVAETKQETVTYSRTDPIRSTEAGQSALDALKARFDSEVLTRTEAFEEAKLDFVVADQDRDGLMTGEEFVLLVRTWRENDAAEGAAAVDATARERQHQAFLDELDADDAQASFEPRAREKFTFMAGASAAIGRDDYLREYLLDFDTMDADDDMLLKAGELMKFRAVNRGENFDL